MDSEHRPHDDETDPEAARPEESPDDLRPRNIRADESAPPFEGEEIGQRPDDPAVDPPDDFQPADAPSVGDFNQTDDRDFDERASDTSPSDEPASEAARAAQDAISATDEESSLAAPPEAALMDPSTQTPSSEIAAPSWSDAHIATFDTMSEYSDASGDAGGDERLGPQVDDGPTSEQSTESHVSASAAGLSQFDADTIAPEFSRGVSDDDRIDPGFSKGGLPEGHAAPGEGHMKDLLHRWNERTSIEHPDLRLQVDSSPAIEVRGDSNPGGVETGVADSPASLHPRSVAMLSGTSDGGPPLARPIVLVRQLDEQLQKLIERALAATAARDAKTVDEIAEAKVSHAFWVRACHERAVWR